MWRQIPLVPEWVWGPSQVITQAVSMAMFRLRVFGRERVPMEGGVLLVSNHQSFLDPPLVTCGLARSVHFLARSSLFRVPGFGTLIRLLHAHPLERGRADAGAVRLAVRLLRSGAAMLVFPEGTRTRDGRLGKLHGGVVSIAARAGVPMVPVAIHGAFEAWPRTAWICRPHPVWVMFGHPMRFAPRNRTELREAVNELRSCLLQLQETLVEISCGRRASRLR